MILSTPIIILNPFPRFVCGRFMGQALFFQMCCLSFSTFNSIEMSLRISLWPVFLHHRSKRVWSGRSRRQDLRGWRLLHLDQRASGVHSGETRGGAAARRNFGSFFFWLFFGHVSAPVHAPLCENFEAGCTLDLQ